MFKKNSTSSKKIKIKIKSKKNLIVESKIKLEYCCIVESQRNIEKKNKT